MQKRKAGGKECNTTPRTGAAACNAGPRPGAEHVSCEALVEQ